MDEAQVAKVLRAACEDEGSQAAWAEKHGFRTTFVSDVINGRRKPSNKLLAALSMERAVVYRRKPG